MGKEAVIILKRTIAVFILIFMVGSIVLPGCSGQATPANQASPSAAAGNTGTPEAAAAEGTQKPDTTEQPSGSPVPQETPAVKEPGAFETNTYRNVFKENGYSDQEIRDKIDQGWNALFYGDENTKFYYESGDAEAYIMDVGHSDVRSEGMSYGMMMCVQMDKKAEFDKLWKWAYTHMLITSGVNQGYFVWSVSPDGTPNDSGPAPDGEEYFALALFFASHRWGDGAAPFDYSNQANAILHNALSKPDSNSGGFNLWDKTAKLIRFVPNSSYSDPSYVLPHFYELYALWSDPEDSQFWKDAAAAGRAYLKTACNPQTGLAPDYATYEGYPASGGSFHDRFSSDAFRVAGNIGLDYLWFAADPWEREEANKIQAFFVKEGIGRHYSNYTVDGKPIKSTNYQSTGLVAMNAMASLAADGPDVKAMVDDFWSKSPATGQWRYYDNCLYFFGLLALSGNYRIW